MRGNDVTKSTSETPTVEMEDTDVATSPLENLSRMSEDIREKIILWTSETPTVEMEDIDVATSPLHNLSRISEDIREKIILWEDKEQKQR